MKPSDLMTRAGEPLSGCNEDETDAPCDFDAFVAQRRGIGYEQAERLIQSWVTEYCPRSRPAINSSAEPDDDRHAVKYDICA
jgi:hypothetical protein